MKQSTAYLLVLLLCPISVLGMEGVEGEELMYLIKFKPTKPKVCENEHKDVTGLNADPLSHSRSRPVRLTAEAKKGVSQSDDMLLNKRKLEVYRLEKQEKISSRSLDAFFPGFTSSPASRSTKAAACPDSAQHKVATQRVAKLRKKNKVVSKSLDDLSLYPTRSTKPKKARKKVGKTGDVLIDRCKVATLEEPHKLRKKNKVVSKSLDDLSIYPTRSTRSNREKKRGGAEKEIKIREEEIETTKKDSKKLSRQTKMLFKAIKKNDPVQAFEAFANGADPSAKHPRTGKAVIEQALSNFERNMRVSVKKQKAVLIFKILLSKDDPDKIFAEVCELKTCKKEVKETAKKDVEGFDEPTGKLFKAIKKNDPDKTREALEEGAYIKTRHPKTGNTVLIEAVINLGKNKEIIKRQNALSILKLLLLPDGNGIDFKAENKKGKTALDFTISYKMPRVQFMLQAAMSCDTAVARYHVDISEEAGLDGLRVTTNRSVEKINAKK